MKAGWEYRALGEVCDIIGGGTPTKGNAQFYDNGTIPWATVRDMKSDIIDDTEYKITPEAIKGSSTNIIPKGNIVIATRVGLGKTCLLARDTAINQDLKGIIPKKHSKLLVGYLFQWFKNNSQTIQEQGTGATVQGVKLPFIKSLIIPMPPIDEQQRIVAILDQAFDAIATAKANTEKNLKNAREIFESHLNAVFTQRGEGWVETTLGKATGGVFTGPFGSLLHKRDYVENGIPLVNPAHITDTGIEPDMRKTVSNETTKRLDSYILHKGDVVIGRRGEMGRCALVTNVENGWLCGTGSFFIRPSDQCDMEYLVRYLRSDGCRKKLDALAGGAVMPNLSNTALGRLALSLPPLQVQKRTLKGINGFSEETQRLESIYQQKLTALDELKKSLLHQAFTGELTTMPDKQLDEVLP